MPVANNCTPDKIIDITPCFQCLTQTELLAVIVLCLAELDGYDLSKDLNTLMEDAACMKCLTDKQMLEGVTAVLANTAIRDGRTMDQIKEDIKCLLCTDPKTLKATIVYLWCKYWTLGPN